MQPSTESWQPDASIEVLQQRAAILAAVRAFFNHRGLLEVETPCLSHATVTDVHLHAFTTEFCSPLDTEQQTLYLQTSPEYAMKRLLCAGSGSIFQICKAFRNEEEGKLHNPEFTLLEWYRVGWDHHQLMREVDALMQHVLQCAPAEIVTYQQCFLQYLNCDPLIADLTQLRDLASAKGFANIANHEKNRDTLLNLLFSHCIEPNIGQQQPCLVTNFPASQSALARINTYDPRVSDRFELYFKGIELANGYHELTDATELAERFAQDNRQREFAKLPKQPIDQHLLAAMQHGLPDCAGVALGLDRLIMLALQKNIIRDVLSFSICKT